MDGPDEPTSVVSHEMATHHCGHTWNLFQHVKSCMNIISTVESFHTVLVWSAPLAVTTRVGAGSGRKRWDTKQGWDTEQNWKASCSGKSSSGLWFFSLTLRTKCEATDPPGKYNKMQKYSWNKNVPLPKCQNDVLTLLKAVVSVK